MTAQLADLVGTLRTAPVLPGARCRGRSELFDGADGLDGDRTRLAAALCQVCPALTACSDWAEQQPENSLEGVIAGRLFTHAAHRSQRKRPDGVAVQPLDAEAVSA